MADSTSAKREKFVQNLIAGMSQRQAYLDAFPNARKWKDNTVDSRACELAKDSKILERLQTLQNQAVSKAILTREERMKILTEIAIDDVQLPKARMQAIDILNKMDGEYVKRIEATVTSPVSEIASKVQDILDE